MRWGLDGNRLQMVGKHIVFDSIGPFLVTCVLFVGEERRVTWAVGNLSVRIFDVERPKSCSSTGTSYTMLNGRGLEADKYNM